MNAIMFFAQAGFDGVNHFLIPVLLLSALGLAMAYLLSGVWRRPLVLDYTAADGKQHQVRDCNLRVCYRQSDGTKAELVAGREVEGVYLTATIYIPSTIGIVLPVLSDVFVARACLKR
jgi:hypothetical protein